jgi:hypothetical protein
MTTAAAVEPITARVFLFGDTDLVQAVQASGVADTVRQELGGFSRATQDEAVQQLARISAEVLDIDLALVLLGAWSRYAALKEAGRRTAAAPESEELVELLSHRVTVDHQPSIDLLVNGKRVATVRFSLQLQVTVDALTATIRRGRLIGLRAGRCDFEASVSIAGNTVARRREQLTLPLAMRLGSGIQLVQ